MIGRPPPPAAPKSDHHGDRPCHPKVAGQTLVPRIDITPRRKYYQFTAIDDCTRLRVLRIYPACNQKTATVGDHRGRLLEHRRGPLRAGDSPDMSSRPVTALSSSMSRTDHS
jgi:hypothetical protein